MSEIKHSVVRTNGIKMHVAETGEGFPVVFCHGFPEMWYSWRHQMKALAEAGFRAIAPDQRGYGETEAPEPVCLDRPAAGCSIDSRIALTGSFSPTRTSKCS